MQIKKVFTAICSFVLAINIQAQVTLQPSIPAVGMIQKNQLWNILVVNSSAVKYDCRLELILRDRQTGQEIMTATTTQFQLAPGAKQLNVTTLNPVQYNYLVTGIDGRLQGLIPAGTYTACYALTSLAVKESRLAEECIQFDAEPLSPPILIFPADSAQLDNPPAQFSWTPPTPDGMFDKLHYEIIVTEIHEGQKAAEAIQENIPFYTDGSLLNNLLNYPRTANAVEKDKWYAWQVIAKDNRNYAGKSEVWVFKVKQDSPKESQVNDSYIFINSNAGENNIFYISSKELLVKYYSREKAAETNLVIKTLDGNIVQQSRQNMVYGDNFFKINLSGAIASGQLYRIEIKDRNDKTYSFIFSINK